MGVKKTNRKRSRLLFEENICQGLTEIAQYIYQGFSEIERGAPWAVGDQKVLTGFKYGKGIMKKLEKELSFLCLFYDWVKVWEGNYEETRIRLRSTIAALQMLWVKSSVRNRLINTLPVDAQAFYSLAFELQGLIEKSKLLVKLWCEYHWAFSSSSSMQMQPKNPDSPPTALFFQCFRNFIFNYRRYKITPFNKQIDILIDKITFMEKVMSNPVAAACTDTNKHLRLKNFTAAFANKATCLALLYWAKEETTTDAEMSILLFSTLHSHIPYAPDVIVLISQNLQHTSPDYSIHLSATVASLVDFIFEHLVDDDSFLILRDPLIRIFTFLTHQNASPEDEEEVDVLRSQAYALIREHSYLLQPHGDMKEKIHLSDFMSQIEITNAKITQLHYGRFSDPCAEAEKFGYLYFVSIERELYLIEERVHEKRVQERSELRINRMELRFMTVFCQCFATWKLAANEDISARLNFIITCLQGIWQKDEAEKGLLAARFHAIRRQKEEAELDSEEANEFRRKNWQPLVFELEGKIQTSKIEIEACCINLLNLSFQSKPSTSNQIAKLLESILGILNDLVYYKAGEIVPYKKQIEMLEEKLLFLKNLLILTTNCTQDSKELGGFRMFVQAFSSDAACLTFLYWAKGANRNIVSEVSHMLSHTLQKITPVTPDVARLYFETLKAIYLQHCDSLLFGQTASIFVHFFLENLRETPSKDDFHDEVIFLLSFLNDPPNNTNSGEVIDDLFWEDVYGFLPFDDAEEDFMSKNMLLSGFIRKIGTVNTKLRQLYCEFPDSSLFNFPKIVSPLFLDFFMNNVRNLKERMISDRKYVPFAKHKIIKIEEELVSIRPFFNYVFDFQSELNETWSDVVDLVHLTEHVISSSISSWFVFDHPIWYHMGYLSNVVERIKVFKTKLQKIKENERSLPPRASIISTPSEQARPSQINDLVVGFEDEAEKIIGMLTRGSTSLDIVSIVGKGGLGKTTIAKKVYGSSSVKGSFDVFAFCSISQDYNTRRLLFDILIDINGQSIQKKDINGQSYKDRLSKMTEDDLAHQLWQFLSRQKYLILLDDIWDVSAWDELKSSFPNHNNGSRLMFTTRLYNVANMCRISCEPHRLRHFSPVESWELFQKKVFHDGISPPYLYVIGRLIAANCKGLPLAVAVIAGLLARTEKSLRWWREVAENVVSYLYSEGCMKILELSYKHLPEILKPCLLFLASFPEDTLIRVKKVILLWIAEGFVQESKIKSLEDRAKDYLNDLVDRNLVIVSTRSSNGGIKDFRVHDLIYELCRRKCREGNFSLLNHGLESFGFSDDSIIKSEQYHVREFRDREFSLRELRLVQVLYFDKYEKFDAEKLTSLVHVRHLDAYFWNPRFTLGGWYESSPKSIPQWICNIWNIGSLILENERNEYIHLPAAFWRMKSLTHVQVKNCILQFPDDGHDEHEAYPKLDKVIHFSEAVLFTGKDVQRLLQRLPVVQKLSCRYGVKRQPLIRLDISPNNNTESVEILDFHRKLESLKLNIRRGKRQHLIHYPPTLKKLTLIGLKLMRSDISVIAELHYLEVLKLRSVSIQEDRLEMEELIFHNLKFFELRSVKLVEWKASTNSLPCLEQLVINYCYSLEELPPCFGEISTLKRIVLRGSNRKQVVKSSAIQIQDEQRDVGNEVEVSILKD